MTVLEKKHMHVQCTLYIVQCTCLLHCMFCVHVVLYVCARLCACGYTLSMPSHYKLCYFIYFNLGILFQYFRLDLITFLFLNLNIMIHI